ncbi:MAG: hypothetical protein IT342_19475 [Candidatus Melainabacteria bacterium]|nr:hypothetical protein [Candidatus Melainabacteria bacterium]
MALSLILFLMHGALVFKLSGADLTECMRPVKRLHYHQIMMPLSPATEYIRPSTADVGVIRCETLFKVSERGDADTYKSVCSKHYWANDSADSLFQNVGQLVGKHISEWINGPCAEICDWLMSTIETLIAFPNLVFQCLHGVAYHESAFPVEETRPLGRPLASAMKGGLMAGAGMLAHAFTPCVGSAYGGVMFVYVGEVVALFGLIYYSCVGVLIVAQLLYLLLLAASQSFYVVLHAVLGPMFLASGAYRRTSTIAAAYKTHWLELALWMVAWTAMLKSLRFVLFFDINPFYKIAISSVILQLMIFTPGFLSKLSLSPISKYLAIDPVRGIAAGVLQLVKAAIEIHKGLKAPG